MSLSGKIALITGGGSGIGRATCQILARDGASIIAADFNAKSAQETVSMLKHQKKESISVAMDVSNSTSVKSALKTIMETYKKPPSIIVNCAGITRDNFLLKLSEESFQEVIDVNLKGTFNVMHTFCNAIKEHEIPSSSVINIGSIVAMFGNIGQTNYCASKAGVELLSKSAANELGRIGIRVNVIRPGFIETPMIATVPEKLREMFKQKVALGRFGKPEEIGEVVSFLASEKSSFISGAIIDVNGGLNM